MFELAQAFRTGDGIRVRTTASESERRSIGVLADWASECMRYDEAAADTFAATARAQVDNGIAIDRIISAIGTTLERSGKPTLAGLAELVFAQAMAGTSEPSEASLSLRRGAYVKAA